MLIELSGFKFAWRSADVGSGAAGDYTHLTRRSQVSSRFTLTPTRLCLRLRTQSCRSAVLPASSSLGRPVNFQGLDAAEGIRSLRRCVLELRVRRSIQVGMGDLGGASISLPGTGGFIS